MSFNPCHLRGISHQKVCVLTALDLHLNHIKIPSTKYRLNNYNIQKINGLHSKIKSFFVAYKGVSTKYLSNYIALFHYIFDKIKSSPLLIRGEQPFRNSNFKGRPPIFD